MLWTTPLGVIQFYKSHDSNINKGVTLNAGLRSSTTNACQKEPTVHTSLAAHITSQYHVKEDSSVEPIITRAKIRNHPSLNILPDKGGLYKLATGRLSMSSLTQPGISGQRRFGCAVWAFQDSAFQRACQK